MGTHRFHVVVIDHLLDGLIGILWVDYRKHLRDCIDNTIAVLERDEYRSAVACGCVLNLHVSAERSRMAGHMSGAQLLCSACETHPLLPRVRPRRISGNTRTRLIVSPLYPACTWKRGGGRLKQQCIVVSAKTSTTCDVFVVWMGTRMWAHRNSCQCGIEHMLSS